MKYSIRKISPGCSAALELCAGFSLVELVVVMIILAIVTSVATVKLSYVMQQTSAKTSNRGLDQIYEAVMGRDFERDDRGVRIRSGFIADMGRLPIALTNAAGKLTLSELWEKPKDVEMFDVRKAEGR